MKNLLNVIFQPVKTFYGVKTNDKFSMISFLVILLLMLINLFLRIPVDERVSLLTLSAMNIPESQMGSIIQISHKMRYLNVFINETLYIIMFFLYAFFLYLFAKATKSNPTYKKMLQLLIYTYTAVALGDLANTWLIYLKGLENITGTYDIYLTGINNFTSVDKIGPTCYTFLSYINPFQLWYIVLLFLGIKTILEIKRTKALLITVLFWLTTTLIPVLFIYFTELSKTRMNI